MSENYICTSCGYKGKPKKWTKGSFAIEVLLWFFFLVPGLIYSIWRLCNKVEVCPSCKQPTMIPSWSPRGQNLMHEFKHGENITNEYFHNGAKITNSRPNAFDNKKPIWKKWWFWIILVIGLIFLRIALISAENITKKVEEQATQEELSTSIKASQINQYIFDVPSLVGKDLNGVIAVLGTPKGQDPTVQQIALGVEEWDKIFVKDGKDLLVTYTISNRKIIDFFISADDPSGKTKNITRLMELGNLKQNDPRYKIEFVKTLKDPSSFTGVKITPK